MPHSDDFIEHIANERTVYTGNTIKVLELEVETRPGRHENLEIVQKAGDSVAILPIDDQGNVHLIEEYYAAVNRRLYSLPKGTVEAGEETQAAAIREMQEEVGLVGDLTPLAIFDLSPGYLRQRTSVFLARNLQKKSAKGDEITFIAPVVFPYEKAVEMAHKGELTEARLVAALFLAAPYLERGRSAGTTLE
jgi:ADP-ribose diphosphatase